MKHFFPGTRETAFIYGILSAGVVHAVTHACSLGNLTDCSCDTSRYGEHTVEGWKWGGCSDNIKYGIKFSRRFIDAPETLMHQNSQNVRNKMNLHNNQVGRSVCMSFVHSNIKKQFRYKCMWMTSKMLNW